MPLRNPLKVEHNVTSRPVLLGVGANLNSPVGPPIVTISKLLPELAGAGFKVCAVSPYYQTRAFPASSDPDYVNAAILCDCDLVAIEILAELHRIEEKFGRKRKDRWQARSLDIDLLAVGGDILPDETMHNEWRELGLNAQKNRTPEQLILPHPRLQDRRFVLVPLADIAPDWIHPILGKSVVEMLADLPESAADEIIALVD